MQRPVIYQLNVVAMNQIQSRFNADAGFAV